MKRLIKFWKIIVFDIIGILLMIGAVLTGWLPGPGGIPLFIIGLSILAIHHDWAEQLIDKVKDIVEDIGNKIFVDNKKIQNLYDIVSPIILAIGSAVILLHSAVWEISIGIFLCFASLTLFLGNKKRYKSIKRFFKHKN